jgi:large subunit ribosomal protein L28e
VETRPQESSYTSRDTYLRKHVNGIIRTYKGIVSSIAKSGYRSDLRAEAVARASAIRLSQTPKKDALEKKLRGAKAKKAAAEKNE